MKTIQGKKVIPYNPFINIPTLSHLVMTESTKETRQITNQEGEKYEYEVGEIFLERKLTFLELIEIYKKLNLYYPILSILRKSIGGDILSSSNYFFGKIDRSLKSCYSVNFPTSAKEKIVTEQGKSKYIINKEAERQLSIFTRLKRVEFTPNKKFFKEVETLRIDQQLADKLKEEITKSLTECLNLLEVNRMGKIAIESFRHQIIHSYCRNLQDIVDTINIISKEHGVNLDFNLEEIVERSNNMVNGSIKFILKRKWVEMPKKKPNGNFKKNPQPKKFERKNKNDMVGYKKNKK